MASKKKLLQAAAGSAGGAALDVDDVFSTYLYDGTSSAQTIHNGISLGDNYHGPSGKFDGSSKLVRTSDLSGNADGKTFTFSAWVNYTDVSSTQRIYSGGQENDGDFLIYLSSTGTITVLAHNTATTTTLQYTSSTTLSADTWHHVLFSFDMANSSNRYAYLDDVAMSGTYSTYTNADIEFANADHVIGSHPTISSQNFNGWMAEVFLDYTYRDLSTTSNRRLFITSGYLPATGLASLNPILYLPMGTASLGSNSGTGGDFTNTNVALDSNFGPFSGTGEGGLVWFKDRNFANNHRLYDTARGVRKYLDSSSTAAEATNSGSGNSNGISAFNSNGFTIGNDGYINDSSSEFVSWTWRKAPKFFDVVTYTGNGAFSQVINHSLGCEVGAIFIKRTDASANWLCAMRVGTNSYKAMYLNTNDAAVGGNFSPSANTERFVVGGNWNGDNVSPINTNGATYVAYVFAHNDGDGEFGPDADQDIIKCGSYTGNGSTTGPTVDLGFEPQWLLIKRATATANWFLVDNMRGLPVGANSNPLFPNSSNAESTSGAAIDVLPTGFQPKAASIFINNSGDTYIYMAIRRGPLAAPESATDVFKVDQGHASNVPNFESGFPVDFGLLRQTSADGFKASARLTEGKYLETSSTAAESSNSNYSFDYQDGWVGSAFGTSYYSWMWKRAPEYFDVVAYSGTGSATTISHNLGVVPEMMWVKARSHAVNWGVYHKDLSAGQYLILNKTNAVDTNSAYFTTTAPTSSVFSIGVGEYTNQSSSHTYIAYLFATVAGVSKVGSFQGDGGDVTVDCGFTNGCKFILFKDTGSGAHWRVFDSVRGINSGADPMLSLNLTSAQVTTSDVVDPTSSGFTALSTSANVYIFYAIANDPS